MKLLSLDFELMGVFEGAFVKSWICEKAGGYPSDAGGSVPTTINKVENPWVHEDISDYDPLKAKLAAQNGLEGNAAIGRNRDKIGEWIDDVTRENDTVWVGHNFRAHDWRFIKSLGIYRKKPRPPIIDTLELALLLQPENKRLALDKKYKDAALAQDESDASPADHAFEAETTNCPVEDAKEAYGWACGENNEEGLLHEIQAHPLKELLHQILLRDAERSEWLRKDWQSVINYGETASTQEENLKDRDSASCDEVLKTLRSTLKCICSGNAKDFKDKFCEYLEKEPYACAYFVCWLAKAQGTAKENCAWEKGTGKFAPHPWITQKYPAVLHLIRLYFANEPAAKPLEERLHEFSAKAKAEKWKLKGRYVEIPAACKKSVLFGPKFPKKLLDGAPDNSEVPAFGIHQADVIGRILGHETKSESGRTEPDNVTDPFSPANIFVAPTGFGKSLCYQLPAFIMAQAWKALTLVVSPLQAIQLDQVRGMARGNDDIFVLNTESYGIKDSGESQGEGCFTVAFLNSTLTPKERAKIASAVRQGKCDMLFLAPEQLLNPGVVKMLSCRDIGLVALDEAHCLSSWGQQFRPEYMYVAKWLDRYCQQRLQREKNGLAPAAFEKTSNTEEEGKKPSGDNSPLSDDLTALAWSSYKDITDRYAPFPRVALFTATLDYQAKEQLQRLFLSGNADEDADHIIGGYASRDEIKYEVESGAKKHATRRSYAIALVQTDFSTAVKKPIWKLPVLLYSTTIKQTEEIFGKEQQEGLASEVRKLSKSKHDHVAIYHGQMEAAERRRILDAFVGCEKDAPNIILCTSAFGMGVDRPDICAVIMLGMPPSLNDLLQQAGRAARDPEKMTDTLGGTKESARAILYHYSKYDAEDHLNMALANSIDVELLKDVWGKLRERHKDLKSAVTNACGAHSSAGSVANFAFDPVNNCLVLGKLSVSEQTFDEILANRKSRLKNTNKTPNKSTTEQKKEEDNKRKSQWLRQCFYWLERLGMTERLPNPPRSPKFTLTKEFGALNREDEVAKLIKDLATLFGEEGQFPEYELPRDKVAQWRETTKEQRTTYKSKPSDRLEIVRKWTALLRDALGSETKKTTDPNSAALDEPPLLLPLKSDAVKFILWPLLIEKLKHKNLNDHSLASVKRHADDVIAFLNHQGEHFNDPGTLFALLRKLGWIEDNQSFLVAISEVDQLKNNLKDLEAKVNSWLAAEHKEAVDCFSEGYPGVVEAKPLAQLLEIVGAITGIASDENPKERAIKADHVDAVSKLLGALIKTFADEFSQNGIIALRPSDLGEKLNDALEELWRLDPLFSSDAVGVTTEFIGWLHQWKQPLFYLQDGGSKVTASYCLRVLTPTKEELPDNIEGLLKEAEKSAEQQLNFLKDYYIGLKHLGDRSNTIKYYQCEENPRARECLIREYFDPRQSLEKLIKQLEDRTVENSPKLGEAKGHVPKVSNPSAKGQQAPQPNQIGEQQKNKREEQKPTVSKNHREVFYQIAEEVSWKLFDGLFEWHNQPQLKSALELLEQLKKLTVEKSTDNKGMLETAGLIRRDGKWFVAKLFFDRAETPFVQTEPAFAVVKSETGITSLASLLAEPRITRKERVRPLTYDDRRELLLSLRKERRGKFRAPRRVAARAKLPSTAAPDEGERLKAEIAGLGSLGFLHRAWRDAPVVKEEAKGWRLREVAVQPGILAECRSLLAKWPGDAKGLAAHLKPFFAELLDHLAGTAGAWPDRLGVFMVPATDKHGWLFCRERWDLFCQRCSAIERDTEEWKSFKKAFKQLWKDPREITLKVAFVKL